MKKKYADQDEEDRKLRMELLGTKEVQKNPKNKQKEDVENYYKNKGKQNKNKQQQNQNQNKFKQGQQQKPEKGKNIV